MFDLATLHKINRPRPVVETETTRHCSFAESSAGIVLHSAKQRSTVFLHHSLSAAFHKRLALADGNRSPSRGTRAARRDAVIESYFA